MIHLLLVFLSFGNPTKKKNLLFVNDVPFGQVGQNLGISRLFYDLPTFEEKFRKGKVKTLNFNDPSIHPDKLIKGYDRKGKIGYEPLQSDIELFSRETRYQPFPGLQMIHNFDSLSTWLRFVDRELDRFRDTTTQRTRDLSKIPLRKQRSWSKIPTLETVCVHYYDPRPKFGKDVVYDFEEFVFHVGKINRLLGSADSNEMRLQAPLADKAFEKYVAKYPDGGPYFQSLIYLFSKRYMQAGRWLKENEHLPSLRIFKFLASQKYMKDKEALDYVKSRFPKTLAYWPKIMTPEAFEARVKEILDSFPETNDNDFKAIFYEECRKVGLDFL